MEIADIVENTLKLLIWWKMKIFFFLFYGVGLWWNIAIVVKKNNV